MIDLHTHILPGMDDGCRTPEESLRLLSMEQGVHTVYLTPHFYPDREEPAHFLQRRAAAFDRLQRVLDGTQPTLRLGAEVAWFPTLPQCEQLRDLTLGQSSYVLVELPFTPWHSRMLDGLYGLPERLGLVPVLAHVERYWGVQDRHMLQDLYQMGFPLQMNASSFLRHRWKHQGALKSGQWLLASDCHNDTTRPPDLPQAAQLLRSKLPKHAEAMLSWRPE